MAGNTNFYPSGSTLVRVENDCGPYLRRLAGEFPAEFRRSLRHIGWRLRNALSNASANGGPARDPWPGLSEIRTYRHIERIKRGRGILRSRRKADRDKVNNVRWSRFRVGSRAYGPYGKMRNAVAYRVEPTALRVSVGWLSASAARWGRDIAGGARGAAGNLRSGSQPVTPAMRKLFAAIGYVLPKNKTTISTPERPLIRPVFDEIQPQLPDWITNRVEKYLRRLEA